MHAIGLWVRPQALLLSGRHRRSVYLNILKVGNWPESGVDGSDVDHISLN